MVNQFTSNVKIMLNTEKDLEITKIIVIFAVLKQKLTKRVLN